MIGIGLVVVSGSKMAWTCMGIEIDFVFVWLVEIDLMSVLEIVIGFISVKGSELSCFLCGGRK